MAQTYEARKSGHVPGFNNLLLSLFGNLRYALAEEGLLVSMPILHTWKFRYQDIESAIRITCTEAQKLVSECPGIHAPGQYHELNRDLAHLIIYCAPGEIEPNYQSPASSVFNTEEDFVLLTARMGGNPVRLLLSPKDIDGFLASIRPRLHK